MISVIIPTYNGADVLRKSLETWKQQTMPVDEYEVIVVDNNSTEDIRSVVDEINHQSPITYLFEPTPGATAARHCGARAAHGEYLVFADNDGLYNPECLAEILKVYEQFPQVEAVACKIDVKWMDGEQPDWIELYLFMLGKLDYGEVAKAEHGLYLNGGLMSVRKSTFERLHGFNPDLVGSYLIGDGDTGFVKKLHDENALIGWAPKAHMWHMQSVKTHGSREGIARHFFNDGIAESYALYRKEGFRITLTVCRYYLRTLLLFLKKWMQYNVFRKRDYKTYFSFRGRVGQLTFFRYLHQKDLYRQICVKDVY